MPLCLVLLLTVLGAEDVTLDQITGLAKVYLRDSAEVPMAVDVTTLVTDPSGKVKHKGHLTASMVFRGYSFQLGTFSARANKQGLTPFGLRDSLSGDLAAFFGGSLLFAKDGPRPQIRQSDGPGKRLVVVVQNANCPALELNSKFLFPQHPCGVTEIALTSGAGGDLAFQHVGFESVGAAATTKVPHLGDAQLKTFRYGVDFQLKTLPGEAKPYLWPLKTVVTAITDKGTVTITNLYSAKR
jgi:hypothetical protein